MCCIPLQISQFLFRPYLDGLATILRRGVSVSEFAIDILESVLEPCCHVHTIDLHCNLLSWHQSLHIPFEYCQYENN